MAGNLFMTTLILEAIYKLLLIIQNECVDPDGLREGYSHNLLLKSIEFAELIKEELDNR